MTSKLHIYCHHCKDRMGQHGPTPLMKFSQFYEVGNVAKPDMGHQMFFSTDGRIALCIAKRNA